MPPRPLKFAAAVLVCAALAAVPFAAAEAGGYTPAGTPNLCCPAGACGVTVNKPVTIIKPTTVNKTITINKPVTVNKDVDVYKPVTIAKTIDASKNITINKNIDINKTIVINKGGATADASAFAQAWAAASASASVSNNVVIYGGGYNEYVTVSNRGSDIGSVETSGRCEMQEASVVKAIHAVCVSADGHEFPASHMVGDTWIATSLEDEILRCIPGAHLKVTIGDVAQSDQGLAATYAAGQPIECTEGEALRHYKDGMLKCAPKVPVKDCTERTNLRRYGTGEMFFAYRTKVCAGTRTALAPAPSELDVSGMSLEGGVGGE